MLDDASRRALFSAPLITDEFKPAAALVQADFAARSHQGRASRENDDHYLVLRLGRYEETLFTSLSSRDVPSRFDEYGYAAVVADGIGGGGAGAMAARLAISTLTDLHRRTGHWDMRIEPEIASEIVNRSEWLYHRTHEAVLRWYRAHLDVGRMAATLTGMYSAGRDLFVANVGHSRCYLFRGGRLSQLTRDDTLRERLSIGSYPTPIGQGLEDPPHVLTDAIGADGAGPRVIVEHFLLEDDDAILLCTNGLTDVASEDTIADILASKRTPDEQSKLLVETALANGGTDNVTVVVASYRFLETLEPGW